MSNTPLLEQTIARIKLDDDGKFVNQDEIVSWLSEHMTQDQARELAAKAARKARFKIQPHKGGRGARLEVRVSYQVKAQLRQYADAHDLTMADAVERAVLRLIGGEDE